MDKLRTYRKKLIIALTALLVVMLMVSIVYGKYTSSRLNVVDLTVKHTVTLTLNPNYPNSKTAADLTSGTISTDTVVLSEQVSGTDAKVIYPELPKDKLLDPTNGVELDGYILDGWYLDSSCTEGKEVKAGQKITVLNEGGKPATEVTLYAKWKKNEPQEIGGDIFYVDSDVDGAVYKFYDADKKEITEWDKGAGHETETLTALKDAKYYLKVGSNANKTGETAKDYKTDKFYVAALDKNGIRTTKTGKWGAASIEKTSDGIGKGKINTKSVMESIQEKSGSPVVISYPEETIWWSLDDFIKNDSKNKDWYIGSKEEMVKLYDYCADKKYSYFETLSYWTSTKTKYTSPEASKVSFWNLDKWDETDLSTVSYKAIPMRSF